MEKLYKIRRLSDGKYYRGKSKFTKHGSYFRFQQIKESLPWVTSMQDENDLEIVSYEVIEKSIFNTNGKLSKDFLKMVNRERNINKIMGDE